MSNNPYLIPESVMWIEGLAPNNRDVPPRDRINGEHYFDIRDCRPRSRHGDEFLRRVMHDIEHNRNRDHRYAQNHMADSYRYMVEGFEPIKSEDNYLEIEKMNDKQMLVESLLDNANSVNCSFYGSSELYTYKIPKEWEVEEGEFLVVPVRGDRYKIVTIKEVFDGVNNPDEIVLKWAVQKVDFERYIALTELDKKVGDTLVELEKRKVKRELAKEFSIGLTSEEVKQLEADLGIKVDEV